MINSRLPNKANKSLAAAAYVFLLTICQSSLAVPTQYIYSGYVSSVADFTGVSGVGSFISYGMRFQGRFSYDADAPFGYYIEPNRLLFYGPGEPNSVSIGDVTVGGTSGEVQLFDNYPGYPDNVFLASSDYEQSGVPVGLRGYVAVIRLNFFGPINNQSLPLTLEGIGQPFSVTGYSSTAPGPGYFLSFPLIFGYRR